MSVGECITSPNGNMTRASELERDEANTSSMTPKSIMVAKGNTSTDSGIRPWGLLVMLPYTFSCIKGPDREKVTPPGKDRGQATNKETSRRGVRFEYERATLQDKVAPRGRKPPHPSLVTSSCRCKSMIHPKPHCPWPLLLCSSLRHS